jgi:7-cyano-7-deazaguanine synthase
LSRGNQLSCLFIDYGQLAAANELKAARSLCGYYGTSLQMVFVNNGTRYPEGLIRGRNVFLLSVALMSLKDSRGLISIGIHSDTDYPDCTPYFLDSFQRIADLYSDGAVQIDAPLLTWTKPEIQRYCLDEKIPRDLTYSCEAGTLPPCGRCRSCVDMQKSYAYVSPQS